MTPRSNPLPLVTVLIETMKINYQVELFFLDEVIEEDLPSYDKGMVKKIFGEIIKKAKSPLLIPLGSIEPLHGELSGCGKIRMLSDMIRIVVRPTIRQQQPVLLEIIAVGPKAMEEAYLLATVRYKNLKK